MLGRERAVGPEHIPVSPTVPARHIEGPQMVATWVGHATVLVPTQGLNISTDPILSERASTFTFTGPKRVRAPDLRFDHLTKNEFVPHRHNQYKQLEMHYLQSH